VGGEQGVAGSGYFSIMHHYVIVATGRLFWHKCRLRAIGGAAFCLRVRMQGCCKKYDKINFPALLAEQIMAKMLIIASPLGRTLIG
jgi:hypothetical protein